MEFLDEGPSVENLTTKKTFDSIKRSKLKIKLGKNFTITSDSTVPSDSTIISNYTVPSDSTITYNSTPGPGQPYPFFSETKHIITYPSP